MLHLKQNVFLSFFKSKNEDKLTIILIWGPTIFFVISFWRLFFEVKGRYLQIFKKVFNYKIPLMFESENLAMHELLARSQILLFFLIGLIKIYLIGTKVPVFKNRKKGSISLHPNVQQHVGTGPLPPPPH